MNLRHWLSSYWYMAKYFVTMHRRARFTPKQWEELIKRQYFEKFGVYPDLKNPQKYTEKIQWRKLYDHDPVYTVLADKYAVREWVKKKIGEEHLIPLFGVWEHARDIDFSKLPNQFVLKTNHASHTNIIVNDKQSVNEKQLRKQMAFYLKKPFYAQFGEVHYRPIPPKIIAEKLLVPEHGEEAMIDYKFFCFDGKIRMMSLNSKQNGCEVYYRYTPDGTPYLCTPEELPAMERFYREHEEAVRQTMRIAEKLAAGFAHVRVDLYENEGRIYFGEMTFTSGAGYDHIRDDEERGSWWSLESPQVDHALVGL